MEEISCAGNPCPCFSEHIHLVSSERGFLLGIHAHDVTFHQRGLLVHLGAIANVCGILSYAISFPKYPMETLCADIPLDL